MDVYPSVGGCGEHAPFGLEILRRARSAIGRGTIYALGRGGRNPLAELPGDAQGRCDCSAFAAWSCGLDRYQPRSPLLNRFNGGWISTDAIVYDARRPRAESGWFTRVEQPEPGDLVVYGDFREGGRKRQGHVGIVVTTVLGVGAPWRGLRVIDCSGTNQRTTGDAIAERAGDFFGRRGAIFARFDP